MDYELIAKALFENYETIYDVNLDTSEYVSFCQSEDYRKLKLTTSGADFFKALEKKANSIIHPDDVKHVIEMLDKDRLIYYLGREKYYSFIYRILCDGKDVYHRLRATLQPMDDGMHVYIGIKNIDEIMRKDLAQKDKLWAIRQKDYNHLRAILATAAAYMEVNLTKDIVIEKSDDYEQSDSRFICLPSSTELPTYTKTFSWMVNNLLTNCQSGFDKLSRASLLKAFDAGEKRASALFSIKGEEDIPCRGVAFLYEDDFSSDIFAFLVIYDLTESQRKEKQVQSLSEELRNIQVRNFTSQIQPHFLYNTLGSIQEIVLFNPNYASKLIGDFTIYLRGLIKAMTSDRLIPFSQEFENVKAYVNIEKMRMGDKLGVKYDLGARDFPIVPLSVQPLVENAIRHGVYEKGGTVTLCTWEDNSYYFVLVEDDGKGFNTNEPISSDSIGLKNVRYRLSELMDAQLDIKSVEGEGTKALIRVKKI